MDRRLEGIKSMKNHHRNFRGMSYRQIQRANSQNRRQLSKKEQKYLKDKGYKNVGWDNVISLYCKIEEFNGLALESLFLEADRIGNKYQTSQERQEYQQKLAQEVSKIAEQIDKQFPDTEIEVIDFSDNRPRKYQRTRNQKSYRTIKSR